MRTPKFVGNAGIFYDLELGSTNSVRFATNLYHNSGYNFDSAGNVGTKSYDVVNASATYTGESLNFTISAWINNLTNKYYYNAGFFTAFGTIINAGEPRTYGVTLTKKF